MADVTTNIESETWKQNKKDFHFLFYIDCIFI